MNKPVIGLTGPTGSGKSTVAAAFRELGCAVIDADILARRAVQRPDCIAALSREFGADIVSADGSLDRRLLAKRAFSSPGRTERLNQITHPAIKEETVRRIGELRGSGAKAIVLDAALLFESGADSLCDTAVAVTAPPEIRLKRIMKRDGIAEEAAKERMNAQNPNGYYEKRAKYVFDGCTDFCAVRDGAARLLKQILEEEN
ncbi:MULTISPECIES: dephospho-CoA kinase [Acutalibacteraceae]|uniref:dephospho-CoA kinase n=1 Tax=Acutalibacteraceae TaxID=3082771 RepID=UPI0013E8B61F|nr:MULTISPECIES: dephospho-CoA kinase [Acutalibacteraceae]